MAGGRRQKGVLGRLGKGGERPGKGSDGSFYSPRLGVPGDFIDGVYEIVVGGIGQKL